MLAPDGWVIISISIISISISIILEAKKGSSEPIQTTRRLKKNCSGGTRQQGRTLLSCPLSSLADRRFCEDWASASLPNGKWRMMTGGTAAV